MRLSTRRALLLTVLTVALLAAVIALETVRRHNLYWYDVRQDYSYDFSPDGSAAMPVAVTREGFVLPAWAGTWDTALLKIEVSSALLGWWFDPCIEIATDTGIDRQCFERGARGTRYVLLPPTAIQPGRQVALRGNHLNWKTQTGELLLFAAPELRDARILVLAPHPDDAEIAAYGLYSSHESFIVTITAGNYVDGLYSGLHEDEARQDTLRGEVRTWDSLTVPLWGGVPPERVASLGYLTYSLREYHEAARTGAAVPGRFRAVPQAYRQGALLPLLGGREASPDWQSVVADLVAVMQNVRPDVVVTPHPGLDDHLDHQFTTLALLEALEELQDDSTILLLYDNHHRLSEHYPFGPSEARVGLPPWFGSVEFASVYSHDLDMPAQLRKLFALEAMHDLRGAPLRLTGGPIRVFTDRLRQAFELIRRDPFGDYSYFRRAVRPNELFFVYRPRDRAALENSPR